MAVPYTFGTATAAIPLSSLDSNFATTITLGNTAIQLGNTVTTLNNMTLANVTVSSLSTPITPAQGGTGLATLTANNVMLGNGTSNVAFVAPGTFGNVLTSNGTIWSSQAISAGTSIANGTSNVSIATSGGAITVSTNGTQAMLVNTVQGVQVTNTLGVGATTPATSGAGISFPATQSGSSDANTLDDYEEGTWTPTVTFGSGSATVASAAAYIKIGKTCFVNGYISFSSVSVASGASITNFPFTAVSLSGTPRQVFVAREDSATGKMGQFFISAGTTTAGLQDYIGAGGATVIADGYKWVFSGTYNTST